MSDGSGNNTEVLIVGAGPTGLVIALLLTKLGVTVRIVNKTAEPGTTSRALSVTARTLELYRQVGLAAALVEGGVKVPAANFWARRTKVARAPLSAFGRRLDAVSVHADFPTGRP